YYSFFTGQTSQITLINFKYPLNNYELTNTDTLCLSNEILNEKATLINTKSIIMICSN
ncbi:MAG: thiamine diphosphokinase, partial [Bacilli bacterium]